MRETELQNMIRLELGKDPNARIFRNHTGFDQVTNTHYGLCIGSADLIGWKTITIADKRVAQFVALEVKTKTGRLTAEQERFIELVRNAGGVGEVVRSVEDAKRVIL